MCWLYGLRCRADEARSFETDLNPSIDVLNDLITSTMSEEALEYDTSKVYLKDGQHRLTLDQEALSKYLRERGEVCCSRLQHAPVCVLLMCDCGVCDQGSKLSPSHKKYGIEISAPTASEKRKKNISARTAALRKSSEEDQLHERASEALLRGALSCAVAALVLRLSCSPFLLTRTLLLFLLLLTCTQTIG
jgi:hypothetical protein